MNGVLVADKPSGWTSHDVVAAVKKKLGARKVGHLGTLDPMATGALPLVINKATRYARFLDGGEKVYLATMELGVETDTYDSEGAVTSACEVTATEEDVRRALSTFTGRIKQVPPMYSAKKINGVPLYKLARKGVVVEREANEIEIFENEVISISIPFVLERDLCKVDMPRRGRSFRLRRTHDEPQAPGMRRVFSIRGHDSGRNGRLSRREYHPS